MPARPCASALLRCGARGTALGPWRSLAVSWRDRAERVESRRRGVEPARADALQLDFAAVGKREARPGDEVARRHRHQNLAGGCCGSDPCTGVYRDPTWRAAPR